MLLGILMLAISFIDVAGRTAQRNFAIAVIACCIVLILFAARRLTSWSRVGTIVLAIMAVALSVLQITSL